MIFSTSLQQSYIQTGALTRSFAPAAALELADAPELVALAEAVPLLPEAADDEAEDAPEAEPAEEALVAEEAAAVGAEELSEVVDVTVAVTVASVALEITEVPEAADEVDVDEGVVFEGGLAPSMETVHVFSIRTSGWPLSPSMGVSTILHT
jgi:hypothetical protein